MRGEHEETIVKKNRAARTRWKAEEVVEMKQRARSATASEHVASKPFSSKHRTAPHRP